MTRKHLIFLINENKISIIYVCDYHRIRILWYSFQYAESDSMTEKELRKLRRAELLEMLLDQMQENSDLKKELEKSAVEMDSGTGTSDTPNINLAKKEDDSGLVAEAWQIRDELKRENQRSRYAKAVRSTLYILITIAAAAVLISTLLLPIFRIYGSSMTPTLKAGNIVVGVKGSSFDQGDIIAFYYNNKILVKRVIALPGDWVDIDQSGNIYVNDELLDEPYVQDKALGECDIELPYQVPEGRLFVCGDHRSTSVDSRSSSVGCVSEEQIAGKIIFRIWPLSDFGFTD